METAILTTIISAIPATLLAVYSLIRVRKNSKEVEKFKAKYQRTNFTHQLQFQKEFNIYSELWELTIKLIDSISKLTRTDNRGNLQNSIQLVDLLFQANIDLKKYILVNKPFFSETIHKELKDTSMWISRAIKILAERSNITENEFNSKVNELEKELDLLAEKISLAIKNRITINDEAHN
ncbi:MAG: hypothetical protein MUC87_18405 [Bacteroidia bacterium]|jgi:hypothetical protein|nr:hypothetical protein [Bacteroidia bacterium]